MPRLYINKRENKFDSEPVYAISLEQIMDQRQSDEDGNTDDWNLKEAISRVLAEHGYIEVRYSDNHLSYRGVRNAAWEAISDYHKDDD